MSGTAVEFYLSEFRHSAPAPVPWLHEVRSAAIEKLRTGGFPSGRHEDWKYTSVRPITSRRFSVVASSPAAGLARDLVEQHSLRQHGCTELVYIDGVYSADLSASAAAAAPARLLSLAQALRDNLDGVQEIFDRSISREAGAFDAMNSAFSTDGVYLHVPDNAELEHPVHLLFISSGEPSRLASIRNLVAIGANAAAVVIETYAGPERTEYLTNTVTEVVTGAGSRLDHYKLQQEGTSAFHVGGLRVRQQQDSLLESHSISLGGALVRNNLDVELAGPGANVIMNGLYMATGDQHVDNHTCVQHLVPHTGSQEYYRGVLDQKARGVFNGRVVVHPQAQKTDAHQSNANLLLSDKAEVDTKPELEIYADDVKCSHGATVGQLDEDMLFYLRSRAIDAKTSRSLLTFAFAEDIVARLRFIPLRDRLEQFVVGKLPDTDVIREFIK